MQKINFQNLPNTTTPINETNLNALQTNVEGAFSGTKGTSADDTYNQQFLNDHLVNISNEVDEDYRVNIIYSNNMINIETNTDNYYLDSTGTPQSSSSWFYTDYIKVKEGQEIHITGNMAATAGTGVYMCFYNSSKTFVSSVPYTSYREDNSIINIPSGVSYLRMSSIIENENTVKIWIYSSIQVDGNKFSDTLNVGASLDSRSRVNVIVGENIFDGELELGSISNVDGTTTSANDRKRSKSFISVNSNETYKLSISSGNVLVFEYKQNGDFIGTSPTTWTSSPYTFTTTSNTKFVKFVTNNINITQAQIKSTNASIYVDNEEIYNQDIMNYSTSEQRIGTWIDGKPLYRKVIEVGTLPNNTSKTIDTGLTASTTRITKIEGVARDNSSGYCLPIPHINTASLGGGIQFEFNTSGQIFIRTGTNYSSLTGYVILEYTKTTD